MKTITVFLSAGEASGDFLGARLMGALKKKCPSATELRFIGVGGPLMESEGLISLFPLNELSIMGLTEVLPHVIHLKNRLRQTFELITSELPDVVVTIDSPGFNFRLAKAVHTLRKQGLIIPVVHYVAPSVWAWRKKRAAKIARYVDHLLTLLPFEPPYFEKEGLPTTFVGHSVVEAGIKEADGQAFRSDHGIGENIPLLCVLPGSRRGELHKLLPIFEKTVNILAGKVPDLRVVIPTLSSLADYIAETTASWAVPVIVVKGQAPKYQAFRASTAALAASGTVTLELTLAKLPMVVAYRVSTISAWILRRLIKTPYVCLVNIILKRLAVPELLQEDCHPKRLAEVLICLLQDSKARAEQMKDLKEAAQALSQNKTPPSELAASIVLSYACQEDHS